MCGYIFVYLCLSVLKKAHASKGSKLSERGKFILDCLLCALTHKIFQRRDVGRSDRALLSVNLSAVYRSAFSLETLSPIILRYFLVSFLPPLAVEDLRKATYSDMCVSGSEDRESVCVMLNNVTSRELILWKRRNLSSAKRVYLPYNLLSMNR